MRFLAICLLLFVAPTGWSQSGRGGNPFDLSFRLPDSVLIADAASNGNPFDLVPHHFPKKMGPRKERANWIVPRVELPRGKSRNPSFLFVAVLIALGYLTAMVSFFRPVIRKAVKSFQNDNFLNLTFREISSIVASPYGMFYIHFFLQMGIFAFLINRWFLGDAFNNALFLFFCIIGVFAVYMQKHLFLGLIGLIFPVEKEVSKYHFTITIFNLLLGLLLLPLNLFIAWGPPELAQALIYVAFGLIGLFYLMQSFRGLKIGGKFLASAQFHFLAYLCAVEIAPLVVLLKLILLQSGGR